jgi:heptosyltransferase-2
MKVALFLPNWIGDAVMATPALRALRKRFTHAEMVAVLRPYVSDVLAGLDLVDRSIVHDPRGQSREGRGRTFLRRLKQERFDLAVLFPNSLRSAWLAWRSGAKRRVGFARDGRGMLLTDALVPKPRSLPNPVLDEYLRLAGHLGCDVSDRRTEAAILPSDE